MPGQIIATTACKLAHTRSAPSATAHLSSVLCMLYTHTYVLGSYQYLTNLDIEFYPAR